jgi:hypothetical protein
MASTFVHCGDHRRHEKEPEGQLWQAASLNMYNPRISNIRQSSARQDLGDIQVISPQYGRQIADPCAGHRVAMACGFVCPTFILLIYAKKAERRVPTRFLVTIFVGW